MRTAFEKRSDVGKTKIFYPFTYDGLAESASRPCPWDLIVIEGWFGAIDSFIHEVRRMNPDTVIFYYCLDPVFPALENTKRFDVDGYLTNSPSVRDELAKVAPSIYLPLAVDIDTFSQASSIPNRYRHLASVPVFVGSVWVFPQNAT